MNRNLLIGLGVVAGVALLLALSSVFTVHQTSQALVVQLGEIRRVIKEPGLHFKLPLIQSAVYLENRVLDFDAPSEEIILGDQKRLVVDSFARYRIVDPQRFYIAVRTETEWQGRINSYLDSSLREVLAEVPLFTVLSADRATLMNEIRDKVNEEAKGFGVEILDVRIKRADLPAENSQAIYRRMQTEREREAKELRAQGYELGQRIRSRADRERRVILAEARREAQIARGEGDGQAVSISADAFGRDVDFFTFYRSMQAYRDALVDDNTSFVLSPDSEFFRFFNSHVPTAREPQAAEADGPSARSQQRQQAGQTPELPLRPAPGGSGPNTALDTPPAGASQVE